jgi:hypothetical protein
MYKFENKELLTLERGKCFRFEVPEWGEVFVDRKTYNASRTDAKGKKLELLRKHQKAQRDWVMEKTNQFRFESEECQEARVSGISASDANTLVHKCPGLRGRNPYMSEAKLMRKKMRIDKRVSNFFTQHGIKYESEALHVMARVLGPNAELYPGIAHVRGHGKQVGEVHRGHIMMATVPDWIGATPDGITRDARLVEVKVSHVHVALL